MIVLDQTTKKLEIVLAGNVATNQLLVSAFYFDQIPQLATNVLQPRRGASRVATNNTTDVTIVAAPGLSGIRRNIEALSIYNKDTTAATVTIKIDDSGTETELVKQRLAAGDSLNYEHGQGWTFTSPNTGAVTAFAVQTFTSSGTYTPSAGMVYCTVEIVGPGAGGGAIGSGALNAGGGGGAGGYCRKTFTTATIGTSQTVTLGTKGAGGVNGVNGGNGSNGSADSTFGSLLTAAKGSGGLGGSGGASVAGGAGGAATGGDVNIPGQAGSYGASGSAANTFVLGGKGGDSALGYGGIGPAQTSTAATGTNGSGKGSGGSGAANPNQVATNSGGDGTDGWCVVTEYLSV